MGFARQIPFFFENPPFSDRKPPFRPKSTPLFEGFSEGFRRGFRIFNKRFFFLQKKTCANIEIQHFNPLVRLIFMSHQYFLLAVAIAIFRASMFDLFAKEKCWSHLNFNNLVPSRECFPHLIFFLLADVRYHCPT